MGGKALWHRASRIITQGEGNVERVCRGHHVSVAVGARCREGGAARAEGGGAWVAPEGWGGGRSLTRVRQGATYSFSELGRGRGATARPASARLTTPIACAFRFAHEKPREAADVCARLVARQHAPAPLRRFRFLAAGLRVEGRGRSRPGLGRRAARARGQGEGSVPARTNG